MARRPKLKNVGAEPADTHVDTAQSEAVETSESTTGNVGGFAPGVLEHIQGESAMIDADHSRLHSQSEEVSEVSQAPDRSSQASEGAQASNEEAEDGPTQEELEAVGETPRATSNEVADAKTAAANKRRFMGEVARIGADYGNGKVSMIKLAETVTEAAQDGSILADATKAKGKGAPREEDDATTIYRRFKASADAKTTLDDVEGEIGDVDAETPKEVKSQSETSQISKLRKFIRLGNSMREDASDIVRRARNIHLALIKPGADRKGVKPGSTYTILEQIAAEQLRKENNASVYAGQPMTDEQMRAFMTVPVKDDAEAPDAAKKILDALTSVVAAKKGSLKTGREPAIDQDACERAVQALRTALHAENPAKLAEFDKKHAAQAEKDDEALNTGASALPLDAQSEEAPAAG